MTTIVTVHMLQLLFYRLSPAFLQLPEGSANRLWLPLTYVEDTTFAIEDWMMRVCHEYL